MLVAALLVAVILLQQGGAAMGSAFGQGGDSFHTERRGSERVLFFSTIFLGAIFIGLALVNLIL